MLNPSDVLYFLAIERTGSRTMNQILQGLFGDSAFSTTIGFTIMDYKELPEAERKKHRYVTSHWGYQFESILGIKPRYMTLVRHPVERVLSHYRLLKNHQLTPDQTIQAFVRNPHNRCIIDNFQTHSLCLDFWHDPDPANGAVHHEWLGRIPGSDKDKLVRASDRLQMMDLVGTTERFYEAVMLLKPIFGLPNLITWQNYNETQIEAQRRSLPVEPAVYWEIASRNSLDFKLWEHANWCLNSTLLYHARCKMEVS